MVPCAIPLGKQLPFPLRDSKLLQLTREDMLALWLLFPEAARKRSVLRRVEGKPATWFHHDSPVSEIGPFITTEPTDALSLTALVPSYTKYRRFKKSGRLVCDIHLFNIHSLTCPPSVQHIVHAEGFVHEVAHSIIAPAFYNVGHQLKLPSDEIVDGFDWLAAVFGNAAEKYSPISHYAGVYRNADLSFRNNEGNLLTSISEEMAECVAAHLLGFVFCCDARRRFDPFRDRPEIKQLVHDFLHAELVPASIPTAEST
ncbi:MAG: hypothetical protein UU49_C0012G0002 [Candidatus Magasanikbacteria bacterium GW2011_GWC2_41_17]|uniref:Uncharacterized protein n=2 Tax=Candidatus Magasanikiibacteriota TaxID=1752731 RepID=A0A0G0ZKG9_9BACT|nr:MAG: hypothetical protein UU49_C0012G0002 [Candidatus Magasanikbacteria bacterium GW2011_GWC2_41_17]KKS13473.1 MAG: hypothetical protein UU69_C0004G0009 [Candidatus Magasanikbacteria bacterium GW2011_GWA2_41_55]